MKIELLERAKREVRGVYYRTRGRAETWLVNRYYPLYREWLVQNTPWDNPPDSFKRKVSHFIWMRLSGVKQEEVVMRQTFMQPIEWNCDKQVAIESRIHGQPIIDTEQPFTTEPVREVLNPNGKFFKVVMKTAPAPVIPKPAKRARKRKAA